MTHINNKILFFISASNGLKHNTVFDSFTAAYENICQLIDEENLNFNSEDIPTEEELKNLINRDDDYCKILSNGTWFHIQYFPVFSL